MFQRVTVMYQRTVDLLRCAELGELSPERLLVGQVVSVLSDLVELFAAISWQQVSDGNKVTAPDG